MHELGITKRILDIALDAASQRGAHRVRTIHLKVGEWTAVDPDCIQFYLTEISRGTSAEGVALDVERIPLEAKCSSCGSPFRPENLTFRCPGCGAPDVEIISGRELYVEAVEVE